MKTFFKKQNTGFTLLEMLFSLVIFSFALVSLMGIAGRGVVATVNAKDSLTAQYLAEEILETVRNIRDDGRRDFVTYENEWNSLKTQCIKNGCYLDNSGVLTPCDNALCGELSDESLKKFSQKIIITPEGEDAEQYLKLEAITEWNQRNVPRSYSLVTYLTP